MATRSPGGSARESTGARRLIVAVTGYGQEVDRLKTHEAGFDLHLVKPVDMNELRAVLSQR